MKKILNDPVETSHAIVSAIVLLLAFMFFCI